MTFLLKLMRVALMLSKTATAIGAIVVVIHSVKEITKEPKR